MDRSTRQKLYREIRELIDVINQMDLIDNYRTLHPNTKGYTFSATHGTFSRTDHILGNKQNFNRCKKNWTYHQYFMRSPWFKVTI